MPEQEIRFCTASDGVRIAYATLGSGYPLVYVAGWPVHLELEWQKPFVRRFLEDLAAGVTLIRYDMRGSGLSDRDVTDLSQESLARDLDAVVDHLGLERFALMSLGDIAGPICMTYAADQPDRVSHLVLNSGYIRGADIAPPERRRALIDYVANFGYPTSQLLDSSDVDVAAQRDVREINEEAASHYVQAEVLRTYYEADVSEIIPRIIAPALVLHARGDPLVPFDLGRDLASRLPNATFDPYEGSTAIPWIISSILVREIHRFLGVPSSPSSLEAPAVPCVDYLTPRETEVLALIAAGLTSRAIGHELQLSVRTVERHISNIYAKLNIGSRVQAAAYALDRGLVSAHLALRSSRQLTSPENG
ncbi:MAG TPA: alpha/beta fold hydrolase [Dehalococcoidia bacterium]|nr:alpha/beta fold hydrolase [Dehalococcoidia bacterium]